MARASKEDIKEVHLQTRRTGRLAVLGDLDTSTQEVWIVFHGYRMLATNFATKFQPLLHDRSCIIAPEGLSRFYVDGFTGRVGASWMTREDRLSEIEDQAVWLDHVYEWVHQSIDIRNCKLHLLGFSQGVATLWRWLAVREHIPASISFYAGKIPDEFSQKMNERLAQSQLFFLYGKQDEFLTEERATHLKKLMLQQMPNLRILVFEGKHDIYPEPLEELKRLLGA